MTNREFYSAIIANDTITEDIRTHAQECLAKLDKQNADRKAKPSKSQIENERVKNDIVATVMNSESGMLASEIAQTLGVTTQKVSGLCIILAKENRLTRNDTKVKGKGTLIKWTIPTDENDEIESNNAAEVRE